MRIKYDKDVDIVYFRLSESKIVDSDEILPGIVYDFGGDDQVVGIEILDVKLRNQSELMELTSREDLFLSSQQKKEIEDFFHHQMPVLA